MRKRRETERSKREGREKGGERRESGETVGSSVSGGKFVHLVGGCIKEKSFSQNTSFSIL